MPRIRGCLLPLVGLAVVGTIAVLLVLGLFAPWSYFLGGRFHVPPGWHGVGRLHARSGDFVLYLDLQPTRPSRAGGQPAVTGSALLIAPSGEKYRLRVTGGFVDRWIGLDPDGRRMHVFMHNRRPFQFGAPDGRPRFDLRGEWHDPNLVMSDAGSLSRAFLPDGRAWLARSGPGPRTREVLAVTLAPCGALDSFLAQYGIRR